MVESTEIGDVFWCGLFRRKPWGTNQIILLCFWLHVFPIICFLYFFYVSPLVVVSGQLFLFLLSSISQCFHVSPFVVVSGSFFFLPSFAPHNLILSFVSLGGGVHLFLLFALISHHLSPIPFSCLPWWWCGSFLLQQFNMLWTVAHLYIIYLFTTAISIAMFKYQSIQVKLLYFLAHFPWNHPWGNVAGGTIDRTQWQWVPPHAHARRWDKGPGRYHTHMGMGCSIAGDEHPFPSTRASS